MARAVLTLQTIGRGDGTDTAIIPTYAAVDQANGNSFDNTSRKVYLHVKNANASTIVVTIDVPGTVENEAKPQKTYSMATATELVIGPFGSNFDNDESGDSGSVKAVLVDYDIGASVTAGAFYLPTAQNV